MNEIILKNDDLIGEQERALRENPTGHNEVMEGRKKWVDIAIQNDGRETSIVVHADIQVACHPKYRPGCGRKLKLVCKDGGGK